MSEAMVVGQGTKAEESGAMPPASANHPTPPTRGRAWAGPTYYGRPQLKAAPFNNGVVGGYIFLAGLSGASALIAAIADLAGRGRRGTEGLARRGRYLSLLAPTIGSALLIWDLHTPERFYNMLRVAKRTSPMSIGTWILMSFGAAAIPTAAAQFLADRLPRLRWPGLLARAGQVPAAAAGAGLSTYTAALLSATSTPVWAAAPRSLAVRFGASSVASGAAALSLGERDAGTRRALEGVALAALAVELAATLASHRAYREKGVDEAFAGGWGAAERYGATGLGVVLPMALLSASLARGGGPRSPALSGLASAAILAGSALLRTSIMAVGDESASRPEVSFRFAQPENLPGVAARRRRRVGGGGP